MMKKLTSELQENVSCLKEMLRTEENFDIIDRRTMVADRDACLFSWTAS